MIEPSAVSILCTSTDLVLGGDAGGTATRVVVTTRDGRVVGRGRAGAGNPVARPFGEAAAALAAAAADALAGLDPGRVVGGVVGLAGRSRLDSPPVAAAYAAAWRSVGLRCPLRTVGDAVVAFAAGTAAASGTVLIAGTGAIAVEIADRDVGRTADGLGWLLGDEGGGFWLGLAAARRTARALAAPGRLDAGGPLVRAVTAAVLPGATPGQDAFVGAFHRLPRDRIAALAPLVLDAARAGDPDAVRLVEAAADHLAGTLAALGPGPGPLVLAGGLLTGPAELRSALSERVPLPALVTGDPAGAAAWLAAGARPATHEVFTMAG